MSKPAMLAPGMRVLCRDAEWLVTRVDPSDFAHKHFAVHCVGADDLVRGRESVFLTQLDSPIPVDPKQTTLVPDSSNGFRLAKLFLEAQLRQMPATGEEPDPTGMGAFQPMPFQIETVQRALLQLRPRLLLADSVGLGKTIQVGMILSELMRRGRAGRILVLAKKSMLAQFQAELWNRFGIPLVRLDSVGIAKLRLRIPANKNPFEVYQRVIISIDTLKNIGSYRHFLEKTWWDCVVIDEAHNVAGASVPDRHLSYRLARLLSRRSDSLLLTTATPHNGKRETFGRLISLLDPSAIPDPDLREYDAQDIRGFFFMRFKEDVRKDVGQSLPERRVVPLTETTVTASEPEERVYAIFGELRQETTTARPNWKPEPLTQYGMYKQFLSSPESCRVTLRKRMQTVRSRDPDSPELPYLQRLDAALAGLRIDDSSRYRLFVEQLRKLGWDGSAKSPRVIVFTEYRETQEALARAITAEFKLTYSDKFEDQPQQTLATIHGSFPDIWLMKTVEAFGTGSSPVRMMIATDVASEGINLHHECHELIHYDLPWSIITLIQRNGRIDRIGQTDNPVLRYLRVRTQQGIFKGDEAIFARLIDKVEEINRSTRTGESVLRLYDPEREAEHIATAGLLKGDVTVLDHPAPADNADTSEAASLENVLSDASAAEHAEFLQFLLGNMTATQPQAAPEVKPPEPKPESRLRLMSDRKFLVDGYRLLGESDRDYLPLDETESGKLLLLNAPRDLRRRLGAPDEGSDVIFGATAIPEEAWPEHGQFRLTDDREQVELAIKAARHMSGMWSRELLLTDQHPILRWITERLLMLMKRGECPHITSRKLAAGELCFCFIGQVSSKAGTPLVIDAHAISYHRGGRCQHRPLRDALEAAGFESLINDGRASNAVAAQALLAAAVDASRDHLRQLKEQREKQLTLLIRKEERRLSQWSSRRRELLEDRIAQLGPNHPRAKRYRTELSEMDSFLKDRHENWLAPYFSGAAEPATQLVLVIEGV